MSSDLQVYHALIIFFSCSFGWFLVRMGQLVSLLTNLRHQTSRTDCYKAKNQNMYRPTTNFWW